MIPIASSVFSLLRTVRLVVAVGLVLGLLGCATGPDRRDPFEPWNRKVSAFNEGVDSLVLKPAAIGYREAVPPLVRTGVANFFANLSDVWSTANNLMQLRLQNAAESWMRVGVNSLFGIGGIFDVATDMGIERHREDFGQTLGRWGVETGPYVVLPLLGPSTLRDTVALPVDRWGDPISAFETEVQTGLYVLRAVDVRANLLRASSVLDDVALDKYSFTRDAYLQRRRAQIWRPGADEDDNGKEEAPASSEPPAATPAR